MIKQKGLNKKYPEIIEIWKWGSKIPEWLSDRCKINFIDGNGNLTLDYTETLKGGYELKNADGIGNLVQVKSKSDFVCFGDNKVFSLTPKQFSLLYKIEG